LASHDNNRRHRAHHPNHTESIERITIAVTEIQIQKDKVSMLESRGEDRIVRGGRDDSVPAVFDTDVLQEHTYDGVVIDDEDARLLIHRRRRLLRAL
jgi:acetate kinase